MVWIDCSPWGVSVYWQFKNDRSLKKEDGKRAILMMDLWQNEKQQKKGKTIRFSSHTLSVYLFQVGTSEKDDKKRILCRIWWWGWKEINVLTFFCVLASTWIENEMCWILAFTIRSIFAQFSHYLNVHFCAIFYTLVFGFFSLFVRGPLCFKNAENPEKYIGSYHVLQNEIGK